MCALVCLARLQFNVSIYTRLYSRKKNKKLPFVFNVFGPLVPPVHAYTVVLYTFRDCLCS